MAGRAVLASLSLSVFGCLEAPTPLPAFPFPPEGKVIHIVSGSPVDLNGDGMDDVLVASAFEDDQVTEGHGIYVLLGSTQGFTKTHAGFLTTHASAITPMPMAVTAADVRGSAAADVLAFARLPGSEADSARAFLVLFENLGGLSFAEPLFKETNQRGGGAPEWDRHNAVMLSDFDGDSSADIVFATETQVYTSEIPRSEPRGFEEMLPEIVMRRDVDYFSCIGEIMLLPALQTTASPDLIVADTNLYAYHNANPNWSFSNATLKEIDPVVAHSFATLGDLVGDEQPEIVGGWLSRLSAVSPRAETLTEWRFANLPTANADGNWDDVRIADFDQDTPGNHDAVLLDNSLGADTRQGSVVVLENLFLDDQGLLRSPTRELRYTLPTGYRVTVFLVGDFNGDKTPEILVMDPAGQALCLSVAPLVGIGECPFSSEI